VKSLIVISLVVVLKVLGDVCLSHGMREVGEVHPFDPLSLLSVGLRTVANPWIELAVIMLIAYSLLYLSALSWLDLSFMLPMTAINYVLTALLAWLLLGEKIAATRWAGTLTIAVGVLFVSLSDAAKGGIPVRAGRKRKLPPSTPSSHQDES